MFRTCHILLLLAISVSALTAEAQEPRELQSRDSLRIFDEYGDVQCEDYLARMDAAIIEAQNNPTNKVVVIVYEGKLTQYRYDWNGRSTKYFVNPAIGTAKARIGSMKKCLQLRGDPKNFVFLDGGPGEEFLVRLYVISDLGKLPDSGTSQKRIKYNKGKAKGFCLGFVGHKY